MLLWLASYNLAKFEVMTFRVVYIFFCVTYDTIFSTFAVFTRKLYTYFLLVQIHDTLKFSVGDPDLEPDPHVFGPPGSGYGFICQR